MKNALIVIPAIKKNAVIPDQLVKKLNGITLIQRAINSAKSLTNNIIVITDSEEISLIAQRNALKYHKDIHLEFQTTEIIKQVKQIIQGLEQQDILLYRANTPLIDSDTLKTAYSEYMKDKKYVITSVKQLDRKLLSYKNDELNYTTNNNYFKELKAFLIFDKLNEGIKYKPFVIEHEKSIEIENYQDWWICEKILQRKRIVFNVISSIEVGMGHIYHSLALAHEITSHEIIFVCDKKYEIAVEKITSQDYKVIATEYVLSTILDLKPDLVINDILNTTQEYMKALKENEIKIVNFEDLGEGAVEANLVINELYDEPQLKGGNFLWGHKYITLRDEFDYATAHEYVENITSVLITFGGTDQNNLTLLALNSIIHISSEKNLKIYIVCGPAYMFLSELEKFISESKYKNIELHSGLEVISTIMEETQIAISSNGRAVYELADMNIPSIIISHHERESKHSFTKLERGFINLGIYRKAIDRDIELSFQKLINDADYRKLLYLNIKRYKFRKNKQKVVRTILNLIESSN